jgi:hypothetical protein
MAENTGGWQKILTDGRKYWRMAGNTGGWQRILADGRKYWRIAKKLAFSMMLAI